MLLPRKIAATLALLVLALGLGACFRPASPSAVDLSRFTPSPEGWAETLEETAVRLPTETPFPGGMEFPPAPSPTGTPDLAPDTETTLQIFPLHVGSSWVFEYLGFDAGEEVVWQVVETVVRVDMLDGYYLARMERVAELTEGEPSSDFLMEPQTGTFWYLVDGQRVYRFDSRVSSDLSEAWLSLILPFPAEGAVWYPDPAQRAQIDPGFSGTRFASESFEKVLPTGETRLCYNVATRYNEGVMEETFCEGVGFVFGESTYYEENVGYRYELLAFSLQ
jgi:hypothetical protein